MKQEENKRLLVGVAVKTAAVLVSIYGMCRNAHGLMFLTYFTNLSNIFVDIVFAVFIIQDIKALLTKQAVTRKNTWYRVKFLATISITLTFLVYLLILAPCSEAGFLGAYLNNGAGSLCVHFLNPVLAIVDFLLFDYKFSSDNKDVFYGIIPPLCYVGYVLILGALGIRWGQYEMMAPYNFLNYGAEVGWFGFDLSKMNAASFGVGVFYMIVVLVIIFLGLGKLFLRLKDMRRKSVL